MSEDQSERVPLPKEVRQAVLYSTVQEFSDLSQGPAVQAEASPPAAAPQQTQPVAESPQTDQPKE